MDGMKIARSIALLSYRHYQTYEQLQSDGDRILLADHKAASYQRYQGEKLARRFNAYSYYCLSRSMDSHHVGRHAASAAAALARITARVLVIGLRSDLLFPLKEQEWLAANIAGAGFSVLNSIYGHDGFLLEAEAIGNVVQHFLPADRVLRAN